MKDTMRFVVVVVVIFLSSASAGSSNNKAATVDWDLLIFTQTWSQTFCTLSNDNNVACKVPQAVDDWTIHGLWPNYSNGSFPSNCNNSWPFDFNEIKDLESTLLVHWPNVLVKQSETSLWEHEWKKHGTCAATSLALNSEHNYFSKALALRETINISQRLESQGIIPSSDKQYHYDNVLNGLSQVLKGTPHLECYVPLENPNVFYIGEIRVCMDKTFGIMNCTSSKTESRKSNMMKRVKAPEKKYREYQPCNNSKPLMIPPIQHLY